MNTACLGKHRDFLHRSEIAAQQDNEHPNRKMKFIGLTIATAISLRYWGLKRTLCEHKFSQQAEMSILRKEIV